VVTSRYKISGKSYLGNPAFKIFYRTLLIKNIDCLEARSHIKREKKIELRQKIESRL